MGVPTQGAALIYIVLLYKGQQQHSINVADVQVLNLGWDAIALCCVARWTPGVQARLHPWCYDLQKGRKKSYTGSNSCNVKAMTERCQTQSQL